MAVKIRLARGGSKKRPYYRIVVSQDRSSRDGRFLEKIGIYNPMLPQDDKNRIAIDEDRAKHWLSVGAQPSERVALFFGKAGLIDMPKTPNRPKKSAPGKKAQERLDAAAAAEAEAKEAAAAAKAAEAEAAAAPAPEAEAPAAE